MILPGTGRGHADYAEGVRAMITGPRGTIKSARKLRSGMSLPEATGGQVSWLF